jgi:hypothetical protein
MTSSMGIASMPIARFRKVREREGTVQTWEKIACCLSWLTELDEMSNIPDSHCMPKESSLPIPAGHALRKLGRDIAVARRKRRISTADMAARLFVSRDTLWRLERGDPSVSAGTLATAVFVLGLHDRLANLAAPSMDELALSLDEQRLPKHIRRASAS